MTLRGYGLLVLLSLAPLALTQDTGAISVGNPTDPSSSQPTPSAPDPVPTFIPQAPATATQDVPNTYVVPTQGQQITAVPTLLEPSSGESLVFTNGGPHWTVLLVGGVGLAAVGSLS